MDRYTLDADGFLYYIGDVVPQDATDVFQKAATGEAVISSDPKIADHVETIW